MTHSLPKITVRNTQPGDFAGIIAMTENVYTSSRPWRVDQLQSHLRVFPEGQFVAVEEGTETVFGMAASLIIKWDDYDTFANWQVFTEHGTFTNHDPARGRTLYGAEVMVHPKAQRRGVGSKLYAARRELAEKLGLLRIRAAARLRGYHRHADKMPVDEYVLGVVRGELKDPTLSFQLKHGFQVIDVVYDYLHSDPESRGCAAVIEWLNPKVAKPEDYSKRDPRFLRSA